MGSPFARDRYDVVIAGARCAGASTAMLLARQGLRVLAVDPLRYGSDALSTHALMRGAVFQLHRWGLLDAVRASGAPAIGTTTFHYGDEAIEIPIKPRDGVDALYAPRRTVLDPILVDAASEAGAEVVHGRAVVGLIRDGEGRVRGARIAGADKVEHEVGADLVIGADGIRSRVARLLEIEADYTTPYAACSIYGYFEDVPLRGYHWFYQPGVSIGTIPTNDGETCVFALIPQSRFRERHHEGLEVLFHEAVATVSPAVADVVRPALGEAAAGNGGSGRLRAFAGSPGFLRPPTGPGWALVGDAGYFRDPITAHGISDALREAELISRRITGDDGADLEGYQASRDARVRGLLDVTDRIASFDWDLGEAKALHLELARQMNAQVDVLFEID